MTERNTDLLAHQRVMPTPESTNHTPDNTGYPGHSQNRNDSGYHPNLYQSNSVPAKDISKALTDLSKLYSDNKLKFRGDKYQYMETELRMFYDNCEKVGLPESEFYRGFSSMLGGDARDYFYEKLARQEPPLAFRQMHEAIRTYFETPERLLVYQQEWMAISLQRIINNNPDKTRLECLELILTDIRKLQPGVPPAPSKDQQLRDRAYSAVLGVPECDMALQIAPPTWQGLCNALRTSIATAIRSGKSQEQFT